MDIKWEWIIIVVCDAAVAVDIVDVAVSIIGGGGGAAALALLFNKLTNQHSALCVVELRIKWNEPETMYTDRYTKWACRSCANTQTRSHSHHKIVLSTIDKFIWRAFFPLAPLFHQQKFRSLRRCFFPAKLCWFECLPLEPAQFHTMSSILIILIIFFSCLLLVRCAHLPTARTSSKREAIACADSD